MGARRVSCIAALVALLIVCPGCKLILTPEYTVEPTPISFPDQPIRFLGKHLANDGTLFSTTLFDSTTLYMWRDGEAIEIPTMSGEQPIYYYLTERMGLVVTYFVPTPEGPRRIIGRFVDGEFVEVPSAPSSQVWGNPILMNADGLGNYIGFDGESLSDEQPGDTLVIWNAEGEVRRLELDLPGAKGESLIDIDSVLVTKGMKLVVAFTESSGTSAGRPFIWTEESDFAQLVAGPEGAQTFSLEAMNENGLMCGIAWYADSPPRAWVYRDGYQLLPAASGPNATQTAQDINAAGNIIGTEFNPPISLRKPVLWQWDETGQTYCPVGIYDRSESLILRTGDPYACEINDLGEILLFNAYYLKDVFVPAGGYRSFILHPTEDTPYVVPTRSLTP